MINQLFTFSCQVGRRRWRNRGFRRIRKRSSALRAWRSFTRSRARIASRSLRLLTSPLCLERSSHCWVPQAQENRHFYECSPVFRRPRPARSFGTASRSARVQINVSIVFQSFALFPWLTVLENVEAPLKARGMEPGDRRESSMRILDTVGLDGFQAAYPKELSGGMRQRVGFARALVVEPEVLFMDEPFSALDVLTAENLRSELLELWHKKTIPTKSIFLVTHNIEEAVLLADRIIVLGRNPGHIRTDFKVTLEHPRDRKTAPFTNIVDYIYKVLTRPDVVPANEPAHQHPSSRPVRDQRQMKYETLPHARPGGIAGLLELLIDHKGRADIYRLADDLAFEIDDLFPIVEAAQLLDFLRVEEGDAVMTAAGHEYAESEILRQKELFRKAAIDHVPAAAPDYASTREQVGPYRAGGILSRHAR